MVGVRAVRPYYERAGITIYLGDCREVLPSLDAESVDVTVTSPPYNLGGGKWKFGGDGGKGWRRKGRPDGIGYESWSDDLPDAEYRAFQHEVLAGCLRATKDGGSLFYNHKPRTVEGNLKHPILWLAGAEGWSIRQEIVWNRGSSFNHNPALFWVVDERIWWLTKGKPTLPDRPIALETVWYIPPEQPPPAHPAPFPVAIPLRCIGAVVESTAVVLDPFVGRGTTLRAAKDLGHRAVGIELEEKYAEMAARLLDQETLPLWGAA